MNFSDVWQGMCVLTAIPFVKVFDKMGIRLDIHSQTALGLAKYQWRLLCRAIRPNIRE